MGKKVHYPEETKRKAIEMKQQVYSNQQIMDSLGIKNKLQIKTWMRWIRNGQEHRLSQPIGKPYTYVNGPEELSKEEGMQREIQHLRAKVAVLEKFVEISRG